MLVLEELKTELENCRGDMDGLYSILGIEAAVRESGRLREESAADGFWDDLENSQKTMRAIKRLQSSIEKYDKLKQDLEDTLTMLEIAIADGADEALISEIRSDAQRFKAELEAARLWALLTGDYDEKNAIVSFHSGAGGTEAQDWVRMLYRMYCMWAERRGFKVTVLDYLDGDEAGLKSAEVLIEGENAYGFLKSEAGVHRLVRISPFDSSGRRHTSFASLEVIPEMDGADLNIEIRPEDIQTDFFRASGAGGQKVNKTSSAVRLTHTPTGIVTSCQTQRSQHQNKDYAMKMLISKLAEIKEREHIEKLEDIKGIQKEIAWGAQIRSYVFMPYTLVKDHRSGYECGNVTAVMDGGIDGFITAYLTGLSHGTLKG